MTPTERSERLVGQLKEAMQYINQLQNEKAALQNKSDELTIQKHHWQLRAEKAEFELAAKTAMPAYNEVGFTLLTDMPKGA
jgi:hypothetical protein